MNVIQSAITGQEADVQGISPYSALFDFYNAFNNQNLELMETNWLQSEEVSMSNPLGGVKRGWSDIRRVYEKIFTGNARVYVEFYDYSIHPVEEMFIAVGKERGTLTVNRKIIELAIRTSRTYRMQDGQWKQLHHHGSIDNASILAEYQATVLGKYTGDE